MHRPGWWRRRGPVAILLLPVGLIYAGLDALIRVVQGYNAASAPLPLICVGNLTAGGAGKTPVTQALARLMIAKGERPAIISRGYGRTDRQTLQVDPACHGVQDVGDEPLLHARLCPTFVSADRLAAAHLAAANGATVLILDDGIQHHKIKKDYVIEVRNHIDGLSNAWPLPAGPLRQWFGLGQGGVDLHVRVGKDAVIEAALPEGVSAEKPVAAFCGIADPEKFRQTLKKFEVYPDWFRGFGDHHIFSSAELKELRDLTKSHQMITTQKDWVRLPEDLQAVVMALSYGVRLVAPEKLWSQLKPILDTRRIYSQAPLK